jgi:hypothetical protein
VGVGGEVEHHLFDLGGVGAHPAEVRLKGGRQVNALA